MMTFNPRQLAWPLFGFVIGAVLGCNRIYRPPLTVEFGVIAFCITLVLVLTLTATLIGARLGCLLGGLNLAVPCFVYSTPLYRGLLMCLAAAPFLASAALVAAPESIRRNLPGRVKYLFSWGGTRTMGRCPRKLKLSLIAQLLLATAVLAMAIATIKTVHPTGGWWLLRWCAGGMMIFAFAEMTSACIPLVATVFGVTVPPLMRSPHLSASINEFWTKRWNIFASRKIFLPHCFAPLAKRSVVLALWATFFVSAVAHVLLMNMATGRWDIALLQGAFFLAQPPLILAERHLGVRRWPITAARVWTLSMLALTSPLFVEPTIQFLEASWNNSGLFIGPTLWLLGFVFTISGAICLATLFSEPRAGNISFPVSNSSSMR